MVEDTGRAILDAGNAANGSQGELREAVEKAQGHLKQLQADGGLDQALRDAFCNGAMSIVRHGSLPEGHDWRGYLISQMEIVAGTSSRQVIDKVDELESAGKLVSENGGAVRAYEHSCALRF